MWHCFCCALADVALRAANLPNDPHILRAVALAASDHMSTLALADFLAAQRDGIVSRFVAEIRSRDLSPPGLSRSLLADHIPRFLDEIVAELAMTTQVRTSRDAIDTSATARRHGGQRWGLGYDVDALIREYGVLRQCILQTIRGADVATSIDDYEVLAACINVGIAEAVTEYGKYRDRQVEEQKANLEFVAEAGQLLTSSLDYRSTLGRLTGLLVPRLADWCAVHLDGSDDEIPLAHIDPAKADLLRELFRRYPAPSDANHGHAHVIRTGEHQLIAAVDDATLERHAVDAEHLALLRAIGTCSWLVVPLRVQAQTFGALTLAYSDSQRHYGADDLVLAGEIARRAAVAIENARLFESSQRERSRVESATRAKDEFVAMISHELRTPLNAILGWLRLIRNGSLTDEKRNHAMDVIERNAQAQSQLVADLLDISRAITGKIRLNPTQLDLVNVVEMAIEGSRPALDAKRIVIEQDLVHGDAILRGDGDRLQQVIGNIIANAVKFTPKGGHIRVRLRRIESDVELTVSDDGEGIPASFLPFVFESFRQSDGTSSRAHGGLGIGLSIARHIVELHGGSIRAESAGLGHGATFTVRLSVSPLVSATFGVARVPATAPETVDKPLPGGLQGVQVLVVEDERDARELVTFVLETSGAEVRAAESAREALATLDTFTPHVVLSDIGMPNEDGYALIRSIRTLASEEKRNVPAIALTAFARNEDRARALVEGFNLHLSKPVEPKVLVDSVATLVRHRHSR